jgi:catechol 2,3-dioxygenase-like lactoylglutathione lyase family enzyme
MKTKLTHIAISAVNPSLMKDFYAGVFGLDLVSRRRNGAGFLTDGYINFAINYRKPGYQAGLDHYGFEVDDVDEVRRRIRELYPMVGVTTRPQHRGYVGLASHDPEGKVFDLTYPEMGSQRRLREADQEERTLRYFHHLAIRSIEPRRMAKFYMDVLDLQWAKVPGPDDTTFHLSDGVMNFVLLPWVVTDFAATGIVERPAPDHIGFSVESIDAYKRDLDTMVEARPELAPWADKRDEQRLRDERRAREDLLSKCEYNHSQLWDPEGVFFDVQERATA